MLTAPKGLQNPAHSMQTVHANCRLGGTQVDWTVAQCKTCQPTVANSRCSEAATHPDQRLIEGCMLFALQTQLLWHQGRTD